MKKETTSNLNEYFHDKDADAIPEVSRLFLSESIDASAESELEALWNSGAHVSMDGEDLDNAFEKVGVSIGMTEKKTTIHNWVRVLRDAAAVLFIPVLALSLYFIVDRQKTKGEDAAVLWHDVYANYGEHLEVFLPDSTKVVLNSGSHLIYPDRFDKVRQVFAGGETYFDVAKDVDRPFIVETSDMTVRVHGTSFNIRAYPEEKSSETMLLSGSISLRAKVGSFGEEISMKPGQKVTIGKNEIMVSEFDLSDYKDWTDSDMVFNNETMEDIVKELERIYNVKISIKERTLSERRLFVAYAHGMSLDDMLKALDVDGNLEIRGDRNNFEIKRRH